MFQMHAFNIDSELQICSNSMPNLAKAVLLFLEVTPYFNIGSSVRAKKVRLFVKSKEESEVNFVEKTKYS